MNILDRTKASKWMMRFAWILEIILCISGILIAFTLSYIGVTGENKILSLDTKLILLVGTLPLIGVALTELLKIPLVTGFLYAKSWMIKCIAGTALTAICLLTFETMLTGQEQLFSLRADQIKTQKQDENRVIEKIQLIDNQIESISGLTPAQIKKEASIAINAQLSAINDQIDDLRARETKLITSNNSAEVSELLRQVKQLEKSKNMLIDEKRNNLEIINNEKLALNKDEQNEISNAGIFRKGSIENKYLQRRENLELRRSNIISGFNSDFDSINNDLTSLNKKIAKLSAPTETLKASLEVIAAQIIDLQNDKNRIIKSNNQQVELNVLEAKKSKAAISDLNKDRASLAEELNFIRDNLAIASGESFIHRLAAKIYGVKNLADLSEEQIGSIALIFMCSVAGVISLAGPLLTFVAVSIQIQEEKKPSKSIIRSIRFILAALIKRLRKPKLITEIKEVEVEKEILKEIEVEKIIFQEVVKPEPVEIPVFVQVPVPTDPKDLPKMEELTKEKIKPISAIGGLN